MIDTFDIRLNTYDSPFGDEYHIDELYRYISEKAIWYFDLATPSGDGNTYIPNSYREFSDKGVTFKVDPRNQQIVAKVQPHLLIDPADHVSLFVPSEKEDFVTEFNHIMDVINAPHIDSGLWQASRVDYTANIITPYKQQYIDLMKRNKPKHYMHNYDYETSARSWGNSCTYNNYDKWQELTDKLNDPTKRKPINQSDLLKARNILRLESQCFSGKIRSIKNHFNWDDKNIMNYLDPQVAYYVLMDMVKTYGGDYYTANRQASGNVYEMIDGIRAKADYKDLMKTISQRMAFDSSKGIDDVVESLKSEGIDENRIKYALKKFNVCNINPVPIPTRANIKHLNSLQTLLEDYMKSRVQFVA